QSAVPVDWIRRRSILPAVPSGILRPWRTASDIRESGIVEGWRAARGAMAVPRIRPRDGGARLQSALSGIGARRVLGFPQSPRADPDLHPSLLPGDAGQAAEWPGPPRLQPLPLRRAPNVELLRRGAPPEPDRVPGASEHAEEGELSQ